MDKQELENLTKKMALSFANKLIEMGEGIKEIPWFSSKAEDKKETK